MTIKTKYRVHDKVCFFGYGRIVFGIVEGIKIVVVKHGYKKGRNKGHSVTITYDVQEGSYTGTTHNNLNESSLFGSKEDLKKSL